jgi:21S rRNA (GM2251-2'-O)-methyltransferase
MEILNTCINKGVVLKASLKETIEINHLSTILDDHYQAIPKLNKRGSEQDRQLNANQPPIPLSLQKPLQRMPFWLALDEVQDPQVSIVSMKRLHGWH